ncbi:MetQ/NlpA family ABC transporter substrate-binding protein [Brachyspira alvinipulli]|uniref:MetQ/NlpA family ABC transporter substrate-binding protein n=1 Tax=Brachyspira alvinipulli TaxID=84379 RepID=UPI0004858F01|nr:MetQ/NlpA family ABC transporter substrate-binding protein [Brachyspira alvinipulli]
MKTKILSILFMVLLLSCSNSNNTEKVKSKNDTIVIGCMASNKDVVEEAVKLMEKDGYKIEVKIFDGNNLPALALSANEIDGLILNHKPWVDTFNKANNSHLVLVDGFKYGFFNALYSSKHKSVEEIPDGATITISNDPSNMDRGLRFLEKLGLLKLGDKTGEFYSMLDIKENPKNIKFLEVEITLTAGSYKDVDATIATSIAMKNAGYDARSYIAEDGESGYFPIGLFVNEGNETSQWAEDFVKATQTEEYRTKFNEIFQSAFYIL